MSEEMFGDSVYESGEAIEDADDLDPVENLTGDDPDEIMQTSYDPPDREPYNLRHVPTPNEEVEGESLDQKLSEEVPDVSPDDVSFTDEDPRAGRLVAPDEGWDVDREKDEVATDVGPAGYASSAEEAAMHVVDEQHPVD
ncbi:MAG: DUF5709 domain-containing protein [Jatrophihabitans sp.]|uniref:DUF5709 domain-containing protein n=1 Tax=Jatrophihabitans sp. TaxID=1932789 RepID=UPI003F820D0F